MMRKTCRDCGRVTQTPKNPTYTQDPATCNHALGRAVSQSAAPMVDLAEDLLKYERLELLLSTEDSVAVMTQFQQDCEVQLNHDPKMRASVVIDILRNAIEAVVEARDATHVGYVALPFGGRSGVQPAPSG